MNTVRLEVDNGAERKIIEKRYAIRDRTMRT